jgi:hypothetical protein
VSDLVPCRCRELPGCNRAVDAEDLLCAVCRGGCNAYWWDPGTGERIHVFDEAVGLCPVIP